MILRLVLSAVLSLAGAHLLAPAQAAPLAPGTALSATGLAAALDAAPGQEIAQGAAAVAPAASDPGVSVQQVPVVVGPSVTAPAGGLAADRLVAGAPGDATLAMDPGFGLRQESGVLETGAFQTLGLTWGGADPAASLDVQARARAADGTWSSWRPLAVADDAPDAGTADAARAVRNGTDSVWVGDADAVQLSFAAGAAVPSDLRLTLVDVPEAATPTPTVAVAAAVSGAAATGTIAADASIAALTTAPRVISRAEWGARPQACTPDVASTIVGVVVHHTAGSNAYSSVAEAEAQIRGDQAFHIDGRGWCDIGYNFLVDKWGNIYEGRANSLTKAVIGVHAGGFNTGTVGVSMLGDYSTLTPPAATQEAVAQIAAWRLRQYHRDPAGTLTYKTYGGENSSYPAGSTATLPVIFAHRDVAYTACPGQAGYATLGTIRARARALVGPSLISPVASPSVPVQGASVTLRAPTISNINWRLDVVDPTTGAVLTSSVGYAQEAFGGVVATWNGRDGTGGVVAPGTYGLVLSGTEAGTGTTVLPATTTVHVVLQQNPPTVAAVPLVGGLRFVPLTPTRLLDTRPSGVPLRAGSRVDLTVAGHGGVPADAKAVALNITASGSTATTYVQAWPAGQAQPSSSVLNSDPSRSASAAGVMIGIGGEGKVSLYNNAGSTHLIVDVAGYYTTGAGAAFGALPAAFRAYDTRTSGGRMVNGERRTVTVAGQGGVPSGATAVVLNVTSVVSAGNGYVSVVPSGAAAGATSSVNHLPGQDVANRTTVSLSGGKVDVLLAGASADVVLDVVGWFGAGATSTFTPIAPERAVDTRVTGGAIDAGGSRTVPISSATAVPADATSAVMTLTAARQTSGATYLTVWPTGAARPGTSDLNTGAGRDQSNGAVSGLGAGGAIDVYNNRGSVQVMVDVYGYYR